MERTTYRTRQRHGADIESALADADEAIAAIEDLKRARTALAKARWRMRFAKFTNAVHRILFWFN